MPHLKAEVKSGAVASYGESGNPSSAQPISPGGDGRWLRRFAVTSVIATFFLIVLGGVVRVTGSGLGCGGEWPLCDGSLIPPLTKEDIIEYSHRLVASAIVGPLVAATFLIALLKYRRVMSVLVPAAISLVLLLAQAGLGGVTVLTELPGHIVAAHMALAQGLLACLILTAVATLYAKDSPSRVHPSRAAAEGMPDASDQEAASKYGAAGFPMLAAVAALATYAMLLSGSYVTATPGALAACPQWPLCGGSLLPSDTLQAIHMLHRVVAAVVGGLLLYTLYRGYRLGVTSLSSGETALMVFCALGAALFLAQVFIGAVAIWTHFPVVIRAIHIGLATGVWGVIVTVALISRHLEGTDLSASGESSSRPDMGSAAVGPETA
ncbi:MAG: COX15/CtaA family protein [Chloroflexota bacterium]|nr:COX15/CtaA family protein [Chloroflexota bacterium]